MIITQTKIKAWAIQRGIDKANPSKQMLKLMEEVGEMARALVRNNTDELQLEIGDVMVVLTILCQQLDFSLADCYDQAYQKIKHRKGQNVNGIFVKQENINDGMEWTR